MEGEGDPLSWRIKRVASDEGEQPYYIISKVEEDAQDYEASTLSIRVSSGQESWSAQGLKKPSTRHASALRRIATSLSAHDSQDKTEYKVRFTRKGDVLQFSCQWKEEGSAVFASHQPFTLQNDHKAGIVFDMMLRKCEALEEQSKSASSLQSHYEKLAEKSQMLVREFVDKQEVRDEEMFQKFAILLNEKKKKLRELRDEVKRLKSLQKADKHEDLDTEPSGGEQQQPSDSRTNEEEGKSTEDMETNCTTQASEEVASGSQAMEASSMGHEVESKPGGSSPSSQQLKRGTRRKRD